MSLEESLVASPRDELHTIVQETLAAVKFELSNISAEPGKGSDTRNHALARVCKLRAYLVQKQAELEACGSKLALRLSFMPSIATPSPQALAAAVEKVDTQEYAEAMSRQRRRLNIQVARYLAAANQSQDFDKFCDSEPHLPLRELCDADKYGELNSIAGALHAGDYGPCFAWVSAHKAPLRKMRSPLEYVLHTLKYHDLVSDGQLLEGLRYSRQNLAKAAHLHPDLTKLITGAFLGTPLHDLATARKQALEVAARVFSENYRVMYGLQTEPLLNTLYLGLSAMHMPICDQFNKLKLAHNNCPCCDPLMEPLTSKTTQALHTYSMFGDNPGVNKKTSHIHDFADFEGPPERRCKACVAACRAGKQAPLSRRVFPI